MSELLAHAAQPSAAGNPRFTAAHWSDRWRNHQTLLCALIVVTVLGLALIEPRVISSGNLLNIFTQASFLALFASAQSVVILSRGFDLSIGVTVSMASVVAAMVMVAVPGPWSIALGCSAALAVGLLVGAVNGGLVAVAGMNPFVVTLGTSSVLLSVVSTISGGFPVAGLPDSFAWLAGGTVLGMPVPVIVAAVLMLALHAVVSCSRLGRAWYLVGSNPRAAWVAGIRVPMSQLMAYVFCSGIAVIGALMMTSRTGSGEPNLGGSLTLETIAAAVLGGMRLRGGEGSMAAPVLGALLITVLSNGMALVQVDGYLQQVLLGLIILFSLAFDRKRSTASH